MHWGWNKRQGGPVGLRALSAGAALLLAFAPTQAPAAGAGSAPVTLRCSLSETGTNDTFVQYFIVDSDQKTVSADGDVYRIGEDPHGQTGRVITRWSETEITLINEEWIRNGWQRFRIVTVLDRLTGAIRSEDLNRSYSGTCAIANVAKKLF